MKNTKNCSAGAKKLQDFCRQIELDDNIIEEFLDKNFYQSVCGANFEELHERFIKEREILVNKYKDRFDFDINKTIDLFKNHIFYKSILEMDVAKRNFNPVNLREKIHKSIMLGDFNILNKNSGKNPSGLKIYSADFSKNEFVPYNHSKFLKESSSLCNEIKVFLSREFKDFVLKSPLRFMINGEQAYAYGSEVQISLHHSIVKDYLTGLIFELINDVLRLVNRIQGKEKRLFYSISENCLTFDSSKKSLFYVGKLESDHFTKLAIFENKKEKSFYCKKDSVKKLFSHSVFKSIEGGFTLSKVKSNLIPLSLLTDEEIRDSLKDFLTIKDLSKIKENTEEKSEFSRLMRILEEVC